MWRRTCLFLLLFVFMGEQVAEARHGRPFRRQRERTCCCPAPKSITYFCLESLYMDFEPTGENVLPDLYLCMVHPDSCPNTTEAYADFFYGVRNKNLPYSPQECPQCQYEVTCKYCPAPGHGCLHSPFKTKLAACKWLIKHHYPEGAPQDLECKYYKIQNHSGCPVYAVVIKARAGGDYFGIETGPVIGPPPIHIMNTAPDPQFSSPAMLRVKYNDGGPRNALIWRK
jgi:hypothetical protein